MKLDSPLSQFPSDFCCIVYTCLRAFLSKRKNLFPDYMYVGIKFTFRENLAAIISIYSVVMKKAYFVRQ